MLQQQQTPTGLPGQSPLARYMMAQSPQSGVYRPQISPMNAMSKKQSRSVICMFDYGNDLIDYTGSPNIMAEEEMHFLFKFFSERIQYLGRIIARCQQEGDNENYSCSFDFFGCCSLRST